MCNKRYDVFWILFLKENKKNDKNILEFFIKFCGKKELRIFFWLNIYVLKIKINMGK